MKTKVINLFGGPGSGKSTTAYALCAELKYRGVNCELVTEYAKDATWEKRGKTFFEAQQLIYGKQSFRLHRLIGQVDLIVTDSPLMIGLAYFTDELEGKLPSLKQVIIEDHDRYDNLNFMMRRGDKPYVKQGRTQTKSQAIELDRKIWAILGEAGEHPWPLNYGRQNVSEILEVVLHDTNWERDIPALRLAQ